MFISIVLAVTILLLFVELAIVEDLIKDVVCQHNPCLEAKKKIAAVITVLLIFESNLIKNKRGTS